MIPVMSTITLNPAKVKNVLRYCPNLDILGINSYGGAAGAGQTLRSAERDIPEGERAHHSQRPVEPGDPGMLLALDLPHDDVEDDAEYRDHDDHKQYVAQQQLDVASERDILEEIGELRGDCLHGA